MLTEKDLLKTCDCCEQGVEQHTLYCPYCAYPFESNAYEQNRHKGRMVYIKGELEDAKTRIRGARNLLFFMGGLGFVNAVLYAEQLAFVFSLFVCFIFLIFGLLTERFPLLSLSIVLSVLMFIYILSAIINPSSLMDGIFLKVLYLGGLGFGLFKAYQGQKIKARYGLL